MRIPASHPGEASPGDREDSRGTESLRWNTCPVVALWRKSDNWKCFGFRVCFYVLPFTFFKGCKNDSTQKTPLECHREIGFRRNADRLGSGTLIAFPGIRTRSHFLSTTPSTPGTWSTNRLENLGSHREDLSFGSRKLFRLDVTLTWPDVRKTENATLANDRREEGKW